jgi:hypothetical protein
VLDAAGVDAGALADDVDDLAAVPDRAAGAGVVNFCTVVWTVVVAFFSSAPRVLPRVGCVPLDAPRLVSGSTSSTRRAATMATAAIGAARRRRLLAPSVIGLPFIELSPAYWIVNPCG